MRFRRGAIVGAAVLLWGMAASAQSGGELRERAEAGDVEAQFELARRYATGANDTPRDHAEAVVWFRKAAEQGDARAQMNLAGAYARGRGVDKDDAAAVNWLIRAARQEHPRAMYELGQRFWSGRGVPQSDVVAHMWLERAARKGSPAARYQAGEVAKKLTPEQIEASRRMGLRSRVVGSEKLDL